MEKQVKIKLKIQKGYTSEMFLSCHFLNIHFPLYLRFVCDLTL